MVLFASQGQRVAGTAEVVQLPVAEQAYASPSHLPLGKGRRSERWLSVGSRDSTKDDDSPRNL